MECITKRTLLSDPVTPGEEQVTVDEFLKYVKYTSFEILAPIFHVSGDSVTYSYNELMALFVEMQTNQDGHYRQYLNSIQQEETCYGSS